MRKPVPLANETNEEFTLRLREWKRKSKALRDSRKNRGGRLSGD